MTIFFGTTELTWSHAAAIRPVTRMKLHQDEIFSQTGARTQFKIENHPRSSLVFPMTKSVASQQTQNTVTTEMHLQIQLQNEVLQQNI